jgi:hypothetical protein
MIYISVDLQINYINSHIGQKGFDRLQNKGTGHKLGLPKSALTLT